MIKRRFFKIEHGDKDEVASAASSSSDSDSEIEPQASEEEDSADDGVSVSREEQEDAAESNSTSSGYQSEDSSDNIDDFHPSVTGLPINEEDDELGNERKTCTPQIFGTSGSEFLEKSSNVAENESLPEDLPDYIFKCKSVFKCKICPRVVCLNEETMRAHIKSKKHARSEKLLKEGRLKAMINSDGELDDEGIPAKQQAPISARKQDNPKQKKGGRRRQHSRSQSNRLKKKKMGSDPDSETIKQSKGGPPRKKHKHDD